MIIQRLAIGTAQFGLDYGITNPRGQVPFDEVGQILDTAHQIGVMTLDTAAAYGDAESVLGKLDAVRRFSVVTKINPRDVYAVAPMVESSIERLCGQPAAILLHDAETVIRNPRIWPELVEKCAEFGQINAGVSAYHSEAVDSIIANCGENDWPLPSIVQVPFSVFDQRMAGRLSDWHNLGIEIHARSLYLQGAGFLDPQSVPGYLIPLAPSLQMMEHLTTDLDTDRTTIFLAFCLGYPELSLLVIGMDGYRRFEETVTVLAKAEELAHRLSTDPVSSRLLAEMAIADESVIIPSNWKR